MTFNYIQAVDEFNKIMWNNDCGAGGARLGYLTRFGPEYSWGLTLVVL